MYEGVRFYCTQIP
jgi:hypothetical protein